MISVAPRPPEPLEQAAQAASPYEAQRRGSDPHAGKSGSHRGTAYRHAARPQPPAPRHNGPRPRPRPPPPPTMASAAAAEHGEHPISLNVPTGTNSARMSSVQLDGGARGQSQADDRRQSPAIPAPLAEAPTQRVRLLPPAPPVSASAALRKSLAPGAELLIAPPAGRCTPWRTLFDALASVYFERGAPGTATARRVAAAHAARARLSTDEHTTPITLARVKEAAVAWTASPHGHVGKAGALAGAALATPAGTAGRRQPSANPTEACDYLLMPVYMLLRPHPASKAGAAEALGEMVQRGLASGPPAGAPHER